MKRSLTLPLAALLIAGAITATRCSTARAADKFQLISDPANPLAFYITQGTTQALKIDFAGWGPNWAWIDTGTGKRQPSSDPLTVIGTLTFGDKRTATLKLQATSPTPRTVQLTYTLTADQEIPLTLLAPTFAAPEGAAVQAAITGDTSDTIILPAAPKSIANVTKIIFTPEPSDANKSPFQLTTSASIPVFIDGHLRATLATGLLKAGQTTTTFTLTFPSDITLLTKPSDLDTLAPLLPTADWYPYRPTYNTNRVNALGMDNWLDKPAGKHGPIAIKGDHFETADGTPIKFWGTNLSYALNAPTHADADFTAARFAKYGINAVRMHKFTGPDWEGIGDPKDATKLTPDGLERLDYFSAALAKHGVYFGWSHTYHFKVRPDNKSRLAAYDELMKKGGDTYGVINWAEDVQDLLIEQVTTLLKHKNPYTNKTYAQDPALNFIECHNEDDIFFYTTEPALNDFPTYKKILLTQFSVWLKTKYGTQEKLSGAWKSALKSNESLDQSTIAIQPNPWFTSDQHLPQLSGGDRQRLLDNAAFLHDTQNRFYAKFTKAVRDAGYSGPLVGSPWQAPAQLPHYYNLLSDARVGYVDRHNYFGGKLNDTLLKTPGGGYLSAGLQQVADRPFGLSEWIHVYPSLYATEGPVLLAAYGMGLQGWDASYEFQSTSARLDAAATVGNLPWGVWNADAASQLGQSPLLARMLLRGDITEAPTLSTRNISPQDLATGTFNFKDTVDQKGDIKSFSGNVPAEALAVGKLLVNFTAAPTPSTFPNLSQFQQGTTLTSTTKQLRWDAGGLVTIDTPGTQGLLGFSNGKIAQLSAATISCTSPFASILLTAAEKADTLPTAKRILLSAFARNTNSGFRVLTIDGKTIVDNGKPPILLEPVKATITLPNRRISQVRILDHDGIPTSRTLPIQNNTTFTLDTAKDQSPYYELLLE